MKRYFVDRIEEGHFVICEAEDGSQKVFEKSKIQGEIREGDCLLESDGILSVDEEATRQRREKLRNLQRKLFGR